MSLDRGINVLRCHQAALVLLLVLGPSAVQADKGPKEWLHEGIVRYNVGDREESREALKKALELLGKLPAPQRDARLMGQVQLYLGLNDAVEGRRERARRYFGQALTADPTLELDPERFKKAIVVLFRQARRRIRGWLNVTANIADAVVLVDNRQVGKVPLRRRLPVGKHRVEVLSTDGRLGYLEEVIVSRGSTTMVTARLDPIRGKLTVRSTPPGAEVLVGQQVVGRTPLTRKVVAAGLHQVTVRRDGYIEQIVQVKIFRGQERTVVMKLERMPPPDPAEEPGGEALSHKTLTPAGIKPGTPPAQPPGDQTQPRRRTPEEIAEQLTRTPPLQPRRRIWTWVTGGTAVGAAIAGLVLAMLTEEAVEAYEKETDPEVFKQWEEVVDQRATATNVLFITAGALAVTSVVLFFVEGHQPAPRPSANSARIRIQGLGIAGEF